MKQTTADFAASNGRLTEIGNPGLEIYAGQVAQADHPDLYWPEVWPLYNQLLRRGVVVSQWRELTTAMIPGNTLYWESPLENPTDADLRFVDFLHTVWDDIPGGSQKLMETWANYILAGWVWFENVPARRDGKKANGADWVSVHDDGLVGLRDVAFRHHGSFHKWAFDDNQHLEGFVQRDDSSSKWEVMIPLDRSTHILLGDRTNPEGMSPLEAIWRPNSMYHNFGIIAGIGAERSAGYAKFQSDQALDAADKAAIQAAARALMAAQEGNYIVLPAHIAAEIIDVPFAAGGTVLEMITYLEHLMAKILGVQWASLSLTSDAGSNASMLTSAGMWLKQHNNRISGAAAQIGEQIAAQLRRYNMAQFGSVKRLPVLKATPIEASVGLAELAQFVSTVWPLINPTPEDEAALRRASDWLPERDMAEIMDDETEEEKETAVNEDDKETAVSQTDDEDGEGDSAEFARPVTIEGKKITVTDEEDLADLDDPKELARLGRSLERWSKKNGMNLDKFFGAEAIESDDA